MNMPEKYNRADYLNGVHMEIGSRYLPLPVIQIPQEDISLRVPLYEYSFTAEQRFFEYLNKQNSSSNGALNDSQTTNADQNESAETNQTPISTPSSENESSVRNAYEILRLVEFPTPSPLSANRDSPSRPKQSPELKTYNDLSEFEEHGKNVFDLVELKSIDEKAELQRLWDSNFSNK